MTATSPGLVTDHRVDLTGLSRRTKYSYRVRSTDRAGLSATSGTFNFTTRK
jgi:phosphodiesterase/alkaline phosphatase D-like protein